MPDAISSPAPQNPIKSLLLQQKKEEQYLKAKLDLRKHDGVLLAIIDAPNSECIGLLSSIVRMLDCVRGMQDVDDGKLCSQYSDEKVTIAMQKSARVAVQTFIKCAKDANIEFSIAYHIHGDHHATHSWLRGTSTGALKALVDYASDEIRSQYTDARKSMMTIL